MLLSLKTIGIDVGGTFTDIVLADTATGAVAIHKVSTTPHAPSEGVMQGILAICAANGVPLADIFYVMHGTTTATNAVLENKGARTGLVTNDGFRDILHIARHQRVEHYSIMQELPWQARPLVKRRHCKVVKGRMIPPRGDELEPLDEEGVRRAAKEFNAEGVESVAVCFLFSYLNPDHEDRARAILAQHMPQAFIRTSSSVGRSSANSSGSQRRRYRPSSGQRSAATSATSKARWTKPALPRTCSSWPPMAASPHRRWRWRSWR